MLKHESLHGSLVETLETRVLMSATAKVFDPAVAEDRLVVRADLLKFRADLASSSAVLLADTTAIRANDAGQKATLAPLFLQLHTDVRTMTTTLREDRLNESAATLGDESTIAKALEQALVDRKNPTAEAADQAALHTDRLQLQTDFIAGLNARIATRQADETTIFNDVNTIITTVQSDTTASPALVTAVNKFATDRTARLTTIDADLAAILAARTQLSADLTAEA